MIGKMDIVDSFVSLYTLHPEHETDIMKADSGKVRAGV
jgi:hypothetical protein